VVVAGLGPVTQVVFDGTADGVGPVEGVGVALAPAVGVTLLPGRGVALAVGALEPLGAGVAGDDPVGAGLEADDPVGAAVAVPDVVAAACGAGPTVVPEVHAVNSAAAITGSSRRVWVDVRVMRAFPST
jgi:hypothetical protein